METVCYLCLSCNQNREVWTNFSTNSKTHSPPTPKEMKFHEDPSSGICVVSCGQTDQRKGFALLENPNKKELKIDNKRSEAGKYPRWVKEFKKKMKEGRK